MNPILVHIITTIRQELDLADQMHQSINGVGVDAVGRFDEWIADHFAYIALQTQYWAFVWIEKARVIWEARPNDPSQPLILSALQMLGATAAGLQINLDRVPGQQ